MEVAQAETKRNPSACDACKRRKGKCTGVLPCSYCTSRNIECSFSCAMTKRKAGFTKRQKVEDNRVDSINVQENVSDFNLYHFFDIHI